MKENNFRTLRQGEPIMLTMGQRSAFAYLREMELGSFIRKYGKFYKLMDRDQSPTRLLVKHDVDYLVHAKLIRLQARDSFDDDVIILKPFFVNGATSI